MESLLLHAATMSNCAIRWSDRKSTRLNSSHLVISYAVFCLKKKKPHRRARRETGHARGRRGGLAGGIAHPRESRVPQEPLQSPEGREPRGGLAAPTVRPPRTTRGTRLACGESPGECRGGGDRRNPAIGGGPASVPLRGPSDKDRCDRSGRTQL